MLSKPDTVAMAISPSNAKLIAQTIKTANPTIPIMTLDADLAAEDSALRKTYLGTDNYADGREASASTSRRPSRMAARSARSKAIPAPTTSCAARRACVTR